MNKINMLKIKNNLRLTRNVNTNLYLINLKLTDGHPNLLNSRRYIMTEPISSNPGQGQF